MVAIHETVMEYASSVSIHDRYVVQRDFGRVVATSDVHADLRKFVQVLVSAGLVSSGGPERARAERGSGARAERGSEIEDDPYEYVWTLEWVADDTMLMITGDLVDGRRGSRTVDDQRGSYEMLLHILIFNLRIDARERNSDVLFTIGNHDLYSVLLPRAFPNHELWRSYTDERHVQFAPDGDGDAWDAVLPVLAVPHGSARLGPVRTRRAYWTSRPSCSVTRAPVYTR